MPSKKIFTKSQNIVARQIGEETVLLPIYKSTKDLNCIYTLNKPAARIWELIDSKNSLEDIKKKIAAEFDVTAGELDKRLQGLLDDLKSIKAIS